MEINLQDINKDVVRESVRHLYLENGQVNNDVYNRRFVIWGNGGDAERLYRTLPSVAMQKFLCFCDSSFQRIGSMHHGKKILPKDEVLGWSDINLVLAFHSWTKILKNDAFVNFMKSGGVIYADYPYMSISTQHCILCGGETMEGKAHFAEFINAREFLGKPPQTSLLTCKKCGFTYSSYRPTDEEMEQLYHGYRDEQYFNMRHGFEPQYTRDINDQFLKQGNIQMRRDKIWNFLSPYVSGARSVLDYGGDRGQVIPLQFVDARRAVYEVSGVEVNPGIELICDLREVWSGKWDFIMCLHLLEHVSDPIAIVENMVRGIGDGGFLYIEVPFERPFEAYSDYAFHEHINFYTMYSIEAISRKFGLNIEKMSVLNDGVISVLLCRKS